MSRTDDFIYIVAMYCLDANGETHRMKRPDGTSYRVDSRTVGWFKTFELADEMVMLCAPWDHLYSHAVIEAVPQGLHCIWADSDGNRIGPEVKQWYRLVREEGKNDTECKPERCECPSERLEYGVTIG